MARRNGSATGVLVYLIFARYSLSRGLKAVVLVASYVADCMQPDNIRPVAATRIPSFTFNDDMVYFRSKVLGFAALILRPKRHDSVNLYYPPNPPQFQNLRAHSALRDHACVFFAARGVDFG